MALSKEELSSIREESQKPEHKIEATIEKDPKKKKKLLMISISSFLVILIVAGIGFGFVQSNKPGFLDGFAQCLTDKGAIMYGASFCQYSHAQQGMFGNSVKYLDVRDFTEDRNVKKTPTWLITGKYYENVQSLDRLAILTGCSLR